jgi:hypothetical protein
MAWKEHVPKHGGHYFLVDVETFYPAQTGGKHGPIHVRPLPGQGYDGWAVQCSRKLCRDYPVGTKFRLKATTTDQDGTNYLTSWFGWKFEVLETPKNKS